MGRVQKPFFSGLHWLFDFTPIFTRPNTSSLRNITEALKRLGKQRSCAFIEIVLNILIYLGKNSRPLECGCILMTYNPQKVTCGKI